MRDHFYNLFYYDQFANELILKAIDEVGEAGKAIQLMAHLIAAQQIWYNRCNGIPAGSAVLWPDWKVETIEQLMIENHSKWIGFLNKTNEREFEKQIEYRTLKGEPFADTLSDILFHVINHGTHHRAQAGLHLKLAGLENLPPTDYIFYRRQIK